MMEAEIVNKLKKPQGETNQRPDQLIAEQRRSNDLLDRLITVVTGARIANPETL
jgi:hypothetical protein